MYHIFICDDEKRFTEVLEKRVETCLKEQGQSYEIQIFYNGIEMFQAMQKKAPEILLLDIDMPEISGMELAEQIFSSNMNTNVIFVTNRDDLVFQAKHYQPFRFIRKEKLNQELDEAICHLINKLEKDEKMWEVQTKNGTEILALKNILYIESCKHYLRIRHMDGECEMREKISNLEKWMSNYGFVQTHRSYLVNVRYMKMVRANEVELENGEILSVSRDKAQEVKKKQMIYLRSFAYANS